MTSEDISKEPFYLKLCMMNARVSMFHKSFNDNRLVKFQKEQTTAPKKTVQQKLDTRSKKGIRRSGSKMSRR